MQSRDPNTDLIRASAIALVLIHHIGQELTFLPEAVHSFLRLGAYGVDLFFVLSGWLIGRLYWNERVKFGDVEVRRFWLRRWFRTVPPYLAALPAAYGAVYLFRGDLFDWRYLLFLQNYKLQMPFFLASWSLCVEEHFYLLLPLTLALIFRLRFSPVVALPALASISVIARLVDPTVNPGATAAGVFGYSYTATHLRFEGLCIGVWVAYVSVNCSEIWNAVKTISLLSVAPLMIGFFSIPFWSEWYAYYFGFGYVAIAWTAVLVALIAVPTLKIARYRFIHLLALWSYSIYLTHNLVIHACTLLSDKFGINREISFPLWLALILLAGRSLYGLVEKPTMRLRDSFVPHRTIDIEA
jgi:peptidoglycan/LPS O-acetylase OafA/YrhL